MSTHSVTTTMPEGLRCQIPYVGNKFGIRRLNNESPTHTNALHSMISVDSIYLNSIEVKIRMHIRCSQALMKKFCDQNVLFMQMYFVKFEGK